MYIYIYMVTPPRGDSSSWGWVHYAIQLNSQCDHMFKNTANTGKSYSLNTYDLKYIDISKGKKTNILKTESAFKKGIFSWNCKPFAWKMHLTLQKAAWEAKKCHMRQKNLQTTGAISKHKWTNALGFELQSASNLHRDQTNTSFEPQSAPNLHRTQKATVFNFKVHQTCTGTIGCLCIHICVYNMNDIIIEYPQAPVSLWFICRIPPCLQGLNPTSYPLAFLDCSSWALDLLCCPEVGCETCPVGHYSQEQDATRVCTPCSSGSYQGFLHSKDLPD